MKRLTTAALFALLALALGAPTMAHAGSHPPMTQAQKDAQKQYNKFYKNQSKMQKKQAKQEKKQMKEFKKQHQSVTTVT